MVMSLCSSLRLLPWEWWCARIRGQWFSATSSCTGTRAWSAPRHIRVLRDPQQDEPWNSLWFSFSECLIKLNSHWGYWSMVISKIVFWITCRISLRHMEYDQKHPWTGGCTLPSVIMLGVNCFPIPSCAHLLSPAVPYKAGLHKLWCAKLTDAAWRNQGWGHLQRSSTPQLLTLSPLSIFLFPHKQHLYSLEWVLRSVCKSCSWNHPSLEKVRFCQQLRCQHFAHSLPCREGWSSFHPILPFSIFHKPLWILVIPPRPFSANLRNTLLHFSSSERSIFHWPARRN